MGVDLVDITAKRAALTPHRIAFEDALTGRTLTYAQLEDRCARLADVLAARGVEREDRVAILCRNCIEFFEVLFACAKLGAVLVPLNWRSPASELQALLQDCTPKLLVFGAEDAEMVGALALPLFALENEYDAAIEAASPLQTDQRWRGDATWFLMYTSGTTGQPKGVIQTFQMSVVNAFHVTQAFGLREADTINRPSITLHVSGQMQFHLALGVASIQRPADGV